MNGRIILGLVLLAIAAISFAMGGIPFTREETVIDAGPVEMTAETEDRLSIPPVVGAIAAAAGVILLIGGVRQKV